MNVNEYVSTHYDDYKGDPEQLARAFLNDAFMLEAEELYTAVLPSVRMFTSSVTSRIRKARRGTPPAWAGPSTQNTEARKSAAGPSSGGTEASGATAGPSIPATEATVSTAGPEDDGKKGMITWLTRMRDNLEKISVPGAGILPIVEVTRDQWIAARQSALDLAQGYQRSADEFDRYIQMIDSYPGAECLEDVLEMMENE